MADQRKWFKVWTSIVSDDDFDPSRSSGLIGLGRFAILGAYTALHGQRGVVQIMPDTLFRITQAHTLDDLRADLALKNVHFEEGKNRHGKVTVTWAKWKKYQEDSTQAERAKKSRSKRRGEEIRREEIRRDTDDSVKPDSFSVQDLVDSWNDSFKDKLAQVEWPLSTSRETKARQRIREHVALEFWQTVFNNIASSQFLLGKSNGTWRCSFDFLIKNDTNVMKIYEGVYNREKDHT